MWRPLFRARAIINAEVGAGYISLLVLNCFAKYMRFAVPRRLTWIQTFRFRLNVVLWEKSRGKNETDARKDVARRDKLWGDVRRYSVPSRWRR